ncbi:unnamed protein product [Dicrocoelium dendriticum]|nr:unnamed protein product [Dicrocoelium dendriticum]
MPQPSPSIDWPTRGMFSRTLTRTLVASPRDEDRFFAGRGLLLRGTRIASSRDEDRFSARRGSLLRGTRIASPRDEGRFSVGPWSLSSWDEGRFGAGRGAAGGETTPKRTVWQQRRLRSCRPFSGLASFFVARQARSNGSPKCTLPCIQ